MLPTVRLQKLEDGALEASTNDRQMSNPAERCLLLYLSREVECFSSGRWSPQL
ncbi:MAG: hypothetical protein ACLQU3_01025 [Limisphaerales bacterium]